MRISALLLGAAASLTFVAVIALAVTMAGIVLLAERRAAAAAGP